MSVRFLALFFILRHHCVRAHGERIVVRARVGETVHMSCYDFAPNNGQRVYWYRNLTMISVGPFFNDRRFRLRSESDESELRPLIRLTNLFINLSFFIDNYSLQITAVSLEDEGEYDCTKNPPILSMFTLIISTSTTIPSSTTISPSITISTSTTISTSAAASAPMFNKFPQIVQGSLMILEENVQVDIECVSGDDHYPVSEVYGILTCHNCQ